MTRGRLEVLLAPHGLRMLAVVTAGTGLVLPESDPGEPEAVLILVGHVGSSHWTAFTASPEYSDGLPDPLDRWSRRIGEALALESDGRAVFPFDGPPFHPFQRWAMHARGLQPSPLGMLIDPEFGLWHAWRFALLLPGMIEPPSVASPERPCITCPGRPCLSVCPAGAPGMAGFAHADCLRHLHSASGNSCLENGCLSRTACPVANHWRYVPDHARFHMQALVSSAGGPPGQEV